MLHSRKHPLVVPAHERHRHSRRSSCFATYALCGMLVCFIAQHEGHTCAVGHLTFHPNCPAGCVAASSLQGCEIGQQSFCLMSPTQRPYELGEGSKTGNLLTMFLTGPLMAFCLASGNTDPSIQQLVDLQVRGVES